jgi:AcrR family transcriptional regulator
MPRTVNVAVHRVRREAFLDAAQRFIETKGYEQMSIQDVLDVLDTSRGAFYHYFDSKQALLDAVVDRFADGAMRAVAPVLADPDLPALRKLEAIFGVIARWKAEQKDLVLAIVEVWTSDANAIVREKLRRLAASRLRPLFAAVVAQGTGEGVFAAASPDETATVLVALLQGYEDLIVEQFLACRAGAISLEVVERTYAAFTEAFERILGVPKGSITLVDEATLQFWFG